MKAAVTTNDYDIDASFTTEQAEINDYMQQYAELLDNTSLTSAIMAELVQVDEEELALLRR